MVTFIISQIFAFLSGGAVTAFSNWVKQKGENQQAEIKANTQIELARINAENSMYAHEKDLKLVEAKLDGETENRIIELEKLSKKPTGNKIIDIYNGIIRPTMSLAYTLAFIPSLAIYMIFRQNEWVIVWTWLSTQACLMISFYFSNRIYDKK